MKYYKDENDNVFAYEDNIQEFGHYDEISEIDENGETVVNKIYPAFTVKKGLILITEDEAKELIKPILSQDDIIKNYEITKSQLMNNANKQIEILQDIIDLGMQESNEDEQLKEWKKYRILLNRINVNDAPNIVWPEKPSI